MTTPTMLLVVVICRLISTVGLSVEPDGAKLVRFNSVGGRLSLDPADIEGASRDFGGRVRTEPLAVLRPSSAGDVADLIRSAHCSPVGFPVSARGHGHCTNGQAGAAGGVVVDMSSMRSDGTRLLPPQYSTRLGGYYVDVWGGELWIDVLRWTLRHGGLAPISWTDYLYLSVGGTLSNAGISGQAFHYGPQISNVYEMDVVTGKGELVTCSNEKNPDLFHAVLGGLGQFGIITRARIALEPAPQRVRWIRVLYSNFTAFTRDQEHLISLSLQGKPPSERFDYVEGFVILDEGLVNNWRTSFFSPGNPVKISSLHDRGSVLYCLEVARNYHDFAAGSVDQEVEAVLRRLEFMPGTVFATDVPYVDFLDRVHKKEGELRAKGLWDVPHPWLNLFIPASRIADFDRGVFRGILRRNNTGGPVLIYPMNRSKWDERTSAVTPEEDVFYLVAFLRSALDGRSGDETQSLMRLSQQNEQILNFCRVAAIPVKQYLPHHDSRQSWEEHFGPKWQTFLRRKMEFDPRGILGTGQGIFHHNSGPERSPL